MARSASLKIADNDDGRADDDGADKHPPPFVFNVFREDDNDRVSDGQPPAKRRRRAPPLPRRYVLGKLGQLPSWSRHMTSGSSRI
jgi:hypothetical protein